MAKRHLLLFLALVMLSFNAFSQTQPQGDGTENNPYLISTKAQFEAIAQQQNGASGKYFKQTADIDLGTFENKTSAIIPTFQGTYDGDGYNISYTANATAEANEAKLGLFGMVTGMIKNLNLVNCSMTTSSTGNYTANISLLCAYLNGENALITDCNVINGTINSTIYVSGEWGARVATGLMVGHVNEGQVKYSSTTGSVAGMGYVGGVVGQATNGHIYGCSFVGTAQSNYEIEDLDFSTDNGEAILQDIFGQGRGPYVAGIVGFANNDTEVELCYAKADIIVDEAVVEAAIWFIEWDYDIYKGTGLVSTNIGGVLGNSTGTPIVKNCYSEGTINGQTIDEEGELTNSNGTVSGNYYPGIDCNGDENNTNDAECIANALNSQVPEEDKDKIHFSVSDDNVIFGTIVNTTQICGVPMDLSVIYNSETRKCTATWESATEGEGIIDANTWKYMLSGGDLTQVYNGTITTNTITSSLPASAYPYIFTVYTDCSETVNGLTSDAISQQFTVPCPMPTNLIATNITDEGFTVSWDASVDCQVSFNGNTEIITAENPMTKSFTGLTPATTYQVVVKAKCGGDFVEQASINVTTARLAKPTGLAVETSWDGTAGAGTAEISWTTIEGLTYEVNEEGNTQTTITNLYAGSYAAKVRAKKTIGTTDYYSDWASVYYTISSPGMPSNLQYSFIQEGENYDVNVTWQGGSVTNDGWEMNYTVNNLGTSTPISINETATYTLENQTPGSLLSVSIIEKIGESTSAPLTMQIQVPCLPASDATNVVTTQTTATFTFESAKVGRKIYVNSTEIDASEAQVTINRLISGTNYSCHVREYCTGTLYSETEVASFSTVSCFIVKNLTVSNIEADRATITWETQSSLNDLEYNVKVNGVEQAPQVEKTISLTGLTPATEYTIVVSEECGEGWGEERTINFTTKGVAKNYISAKSGSFSSGDTWIGGIAPSSTDGDGSTITISQGHTVVVDKTLILDAKHTHLYNNGILVIGPQGELINTTDNAVGGIVEVETPIKTMNEWTFIGAPFKNGYKLGYIKPESEDISVSKYNYDNGDWNNTWENVESVMEAGEGFFAWPFYDGVVTFTTYGDVCEWNGTAWVNNSYQANQLPATVLNNEDITITKTIKQSPKGGYWMALANPYPAKLSVSEFLNGNTGIQGNCTYHFNGESWEIKNVTSGNIAITDGFFLNVVSAGEKTITFSKNQLTNNPTSQAKSQVKPIDYITLSLVKGKQKSKLYFAHNEIAEQNYDIFDANKLFALREVAEPYFLTDGNALVKEEVKELPYYATMNVRSFADDTVSFVVENIPEGYYVYLIDNGERIKMHEQIGYLTQIAEGENEDRFKVLVTKTILEDSRAASNIEITNYNREITIESEVENLEIEVYNALGQKVFATKDYNFTLNEVPAGAYLVKAFSGKVRQTQKIVVK